MSVKLSTYINFNNGEAAEAIKFYQSVFGGETYVDTFAGFAERAPDSGMTFDPSEGDKVMHGSLSGDNGIELMISDVPTGMDKVTSGTQITLTLNGDDEETLTEYWNKLSVGGNIDEQLRLAPWGDQFGILTDKFGIKWMFDISPKAA
jgi:PhnB protein